MGAWRCRCGQDNWEDKSHCRGCGASRYKGSAKRMPSQGKRDHGQWKAGKGLEKGGGKGAAKGGDPSQQVQLTAVLPAKPSEARKHPSYLPVPQNPQEKDLHVRTLRSKLNGLNKLREVSILAGKTGSDENTSEIAVLRHMLFAAENPEELHATKTWGRVMELRSQLTIAMQKEREARLKVREIQSVMDHFSEIYDELRQEQESRERSPAPEGAGREEGHGDGSVRMEGAEAAPPPYAGPQQYSPHSQSQFSQAQYSPQSQPLFGTQALGTDSAAPYPGRDGQWSTQQSHEGLSQDWGQHGWHSNAGWNTNDPTQQQSRQEENPLQMQVQWLAQTVGSLMERLGSPPLVTPSPGTGHTMNGPTQAQADACLDLDGAETLAPPQMDSMRTKMHRRTGGGRGPGIATTRERPQRQR